MLTQNVPEELPVTRQLGGIGVTSRMGRFTATSHYFSESRDFHAIYPAGSVECTGDTDGLLSMSAVSYRTSIGTEPSSPASLLRVGSHMHPSNQTNVTELFACT